jgi:toxin-antitoxin system PIN domain toxin
LIAVDTNVLVFAHREDSEWHARALERVVSLAEGRTAWAIPWPCIHEFLAITTHPSIFKPPTPLALALDQVEAWLESPSLVLLAEDDGYWDTLKSILNGGRISGPRVHDARIAALCIRHQGRELWTADRDFSRFSGVPATNPLVN